MIDPDDNTDTPFDRPPVVVPGERIIVQLRHPVSKPAGSDEWQFRADLNAPETKTVLEKDACWPTGPDADYGPESPHTVTICPECIDSWYRDYNITLESESLPPVVGDD